MTDDNRRTRLWVKLYCNYFDDSVFEQLSVFAEVAFVRGLAVAKQENTGFLSRPAARRMIADRVEPGSDPFGELVNVGLWQEVEGGFQIVNWARYQHGESQRVEQGKRGAHRRYHKATPDANCVFCVDEGWVTMGSPIANLWGSHGIPIAVEESRVEENILTGFAEFYAAYPRKVGKGDAEKAWKQTASQRPALSEVLAALDYAMKGWKASNTETRFIPHPATWLRARRWADEVPEVTREVTQRDEVRDKAFGKVIPLKHAGAAREAAEDALEGFPDRVAAEVLEWWDETLTGQGK